MSFDPSKVDRFRTLDSSRGQIATAVLASHYDQLLTVNRTMLVALKRAQHFIARVDELHQTIYYSGLDEQCQEAIAAAEPR